MLTRLLLGPAPSPLLLAIWSIALVALVFLPAVALVAMFSIWWERKVAGHIQSRFGPNRVGPIGLLQSLADGMKLLLKEDLIPAGADHVLFRLAPYLAFVPVFAAFVALPFAPDLIYEPRLSAGVFWIIAILSIEVLGVILAGWSSNNKWSVYGAMREAGQMVAYEIPLGLSILVVVLCAGTLNLVDLSNLQSGGLHTWLIFRNPFTFAAFFVFFVASLASNKRAPFDLPESESELVAGYHTEYSGMRFSFFFFAEYAAMFVIGAVQSVLFLGGWNDPLGLIGYFNHKFTLAANPPLAGVILLNLLAAAIFVIKCLTIVFIQMWLRWTLPRPRIDQVLYVCIKVLLPAACILLVGAAIWQCLIPEMPGLPWHDFSPFSPGTWTVPIANTGYPASRLVTFLVQSLLAAIGAAAFLAIVFYILVARFGRNRTEARLFSLSLPGSGPG
jgi:NADH-quinone oxidoreductase subunit H